MRMFRRLMVLAVFGGGWMAWAFAGCGGSSENKDAEPDVPVMTMDATMDTTTMDVTDAGKPCPTDADLFGLDFSDASWPADAGIDGGSPQICWNCLKTKCMMDIQTCNDDCACKMAVQQFFECVQMNGLQTSCAAPLLNYDPNFALQFGSCALGQCNGPCPIPNLGDGGADGGPSDAGGQ